MLLLFFVFLSFSYWMRRPKATVPLFVSSKVVDFPPTVTL
ncbi:hypothetical protein HMPREF1987_01827 [Peptostreptococcaceae bacterium oral taxon 113 str. W5053]|nr:hypothetical protein HMPREF1987_01827 [Peptostreptococcaceae bacterium oral taxon 113 str. W5053]